MKMGILDVIIHVSRNHTYVHIYFGTHTGILTTAAVHVRIHLANNIV